QSIEALNNMSREEALAVIQKEDEIDKMERMYRKKHIIRVNEGQCSASAGIVFVDIISNLERIGDHAVNIAEEVLGDYKIVSLERKTIVVSLLIYFCEAISRLLKQLR